MSWVDRFKQASRASDANSPHPRTSRCGTALTWAVPNTRKTVPLAGCTKHWTEGVRGEPALTGEAARRRYNPPAQARSQLARVKEVLEPRQATAGEEDGARQADDDPHGTHLDLDHEDYLDWKWVLWHLTVHGRDGAFDRIRAPLASYNNMERFIRPNISCLHLCLEQQFLRRLDHSRLRKAVIDSIGETETLARQSKAARRRREQETPVKRIEAKSKDSPSASETSESELDWDGIGQDVETPVD